MMETINTGNLQLTFSPHEWQKISPEDDHSLAGYYFHEPAVRDIARILTKSGKVELLELREGLTIQTHQYVGSLQLGNLRLNILPKITGLPLLNLLRYAYKLQNLDFFAPMGFGTEFNSFQDLLIQQFAMEAVELLERGLHRRYERILDNLASPHGRIDFSKFVRQGGLISASLPCSYYSRIENNILNQCLLAGLISASNLTNDLILRSHLRQSSHILSQSVVSVPLTMQLLEKSKSAINRLTMNYLPALTIIQILLESQGLSLENDQSRIHLPGFLFDMNRFFQALLDRFLRDNLIGYTVQSEHQLHNMLFYHPLHNPWHWGSPTPRPDFAIKDGNKVIALLDAKYRDVGQNGLPHYMLYQLSIYAFSQSPSRKSTILYPTSIEKSDEAWLQVTHPITGDNLAQVILRPINLYSLEKLIRTGSKSIKEKAAHQIAFGTSC
jgi:5-methylcytosine-specific restriction enzyme subunit McrC